MHIEDAEHDFAAFLDERGLDLELSTADEGIEALLDYYRDVRADDAAIDEEGDMLLFQWGAYSWSDGGFEINLTRQFIGEDGEDDQIWQLSLTYRYHIEDDSPTSGNAWCEHPDEVDDFTEQLWQSEALAAVDELEPDEVELTFGLAE